MLWILYAGKNGDTLASCHKGSRFSLSSAEFPSSLRLTVVRGTLYPSLSKNLLSCCHGVSSGQRGDIILNESLKETIQILKLWGGFRHMWTCAFTLEAVQIIYMYKLIQCTFEAYIFIPLLSSNSSCSSLTHRLLAESPGPWPCLLPYRSLQGVLPSWCPGPAWGGERHQADWDHHQPPVMVQGVPWKKVRPHFLSTDTDTMGTTCKLLLLFSDAIRV